MKVETTSTNTEAMQENIQDYVAQLQLYMALHSRSLVPSLTRIEDPSPRLLQETQATIEKLASRQTR
ncbi:MAG: hypothetical protein ACTMUB_00075 [cyanobacterium endosymbiont of Rhopalodia musculus]|uniref:hypothetical protein n=1 Tax=cyanobacterium endosymbiont of Epithemia clementina EcSB TaxID=3034674 RepID=UPI00247FD913|nr:hypothetical protein [cyanobacterium endosymbiont of Epithemia clementina EcSB]WGT66690.1 hypothetical protein P3F56_05315 [cyanobacterium endosymbiont of Epithemia clementina EcSB]